MAKQITRKAALAKGLPRYFTGRPCKHGHVVERYTASRNCAMCSQIYNRSSAGHMTYIRYQQSPLGRERDFRYNNSPLAQEAQRRYRAGPKGQIEAAMATSSDGKQFVDFTTITTLMAASFCPRGRSI